MPDVDEFSKRPAREEPDAILRRAGRPPVSSLKCDSLLFRYGFAGCRLAALDVVGALERRLLAPGRARERRAIAAREHVAAALGDDVDDAAREAAVFGGDARGEHLHFADRVFDVEVVHRSDQVVVHVDAVDQKHVVVREAAGNGQLIRAGRVGREAGHQLGNQVRRAAHRQRVDFARRDVRAGLHGGDRRRRRRLRRAPSQSPARPTASHRPTRWRRAAAARVSSPGLRPSFANGLCRCRAASSAASRRRCTSVDGRSLALQRRGGRRRRPHRQSRPRRSISRCRSRFRSARLARLPRRAPERDHHQQTEKPAFHVVTFKRSARRVQKSSQPQSRMDATRHRETRNSLIPIGLSD